MTTDLGTLCEPNSRCDSQLVQRVPTSYSTLSPCDRNAKWCRCAQSRSARTPVAPCGPWGLKRKSECGLVDDQQIPRTAARSTLGIYEARRRPERSVLACDDLVIAIATCLRLQVGTASITSSSRTGNGTTLARVPCVSRPGDTNSQIRRTTGSAAKSLGPCGPAGPCAPDDPAAPGAPLAASCKQLVLLALGSEFVFAASASQKAPPSVTASFAL